jgi:hypothetical protein
VRSAPRANLAAPHEKLATYACISQLMHVALQMSTKMTIGIIGQGCQTGRRS